MRKILLVFGIILLMLFSSYVGFSKPVDIKEEPITIQSMNTDIDWWSMFHHDLQSTGFTTSSAPSTNKILWAVGNWEHEWDSPQRCSPVIVNDTVYIGACDPSYPLDQTVNKNFNTISRKNSPYVNRFWRNNRLSPLLWYETYVYAFDANTGNEKWRTYLPEQHFIGGSPAITNERLYITSNYNVFGLEGNLFCLDINSGNILWNFTLYQRYTSPLVHNGKVFILGMEIDQYPIIYAKLYCLDAINGVEIYNVTLGNGEANIAPALYNNKLYISVFDKETSYVYVCCINASNGDFLWSKELEGTWFGSSPVIYNNSVIVSSTYISANPSGSLWSLDADTGDIIWHYFTEEMCNVVTPAVAYGYVYVPLTNYTEFTNGEGEMHCLDAVTGELKWKTYLGYGLDSHPAIADGKVYISTEDFFGTGGFWDGYCHCLDAFTGEIIWNFWLVYGTQSSPAIADGRLYVATPGFLYVFDDTATTNNPPEITITGPTKGKIERSYNYTIVAHDPEGEDVTVFIHFSFEPDGYYYGIFPSDQPFIFSLEFESPIDFFIKTRAQDASYSSSDFAYKYVNITEINVKPTFLFGSIINVEKDGDYSFIIVNKLLSIRLLPLDISLFASGEEIVISNDYFGFVGSSFMIGRFKADVD
ncbi:MAG: PQQ-binding-like beta-propeller repeat protein [Thermoplasmatales archaeon]|nr:MAG: PQQ-binding-like beta-propeller repeat protein [Thermoplasmatales archaeon]